MTVHLNIGYHTTIVTMDLDGREQGARPWSACGDKRAKALSFGASPTGTYQYHGRVTCKRCKKTNAYRARVRNAG